MDEAESHSMQKNRDSSGTCRRKSKTYMIRSEHDGRTALDRATACLDASQRAAQRVNSKQQQCWGQKKDNKMPYSQHS